MAKVAHIINSQFKRIGRDSMLIVLLVYPVLSILGGRFLIPYLYETLLQSGFDLSTHYHAVMVFLVVMNPVLYGNIVGLMLLEEKEERTLDAIRIVPMPFAQYLLVKTFLFVVLSILTGMIVTISVALYPITFGEALGINLLASLGVPFGMLFILMFANNKVEGFAAMKGSGFMLILPIIALYLPGAYKYLMGIFPAFWPTMALAGIYEEANLNVSFGGVLGIGAIYTVLLIYAMYRYVNNYRFR